MRKLLLPILVFGLVLSSCQDDLTSLNEDPKGASEVPAEPLFTNAQTSLADYLTEPNVNLNIFKLVSQYWASTTYTDESQYELRTRQISDNLYSEHYRDILNDLNQAVKIIESNELLAADVKANQLAQIEVVSIYAWYNLVTIFGDIPYSEALDPDNTQPAFDGQQAIYTDLMSRLDTAIGNFSPGAAGFTADGDLFYQGDISKWVKFAHSLKMRMAITVADNPPSGVDPQAAIEAASPNAFTSNADNATFTFVSAPPWTNPIWEALVQSGRNDYVPANTFVDNMNNLNDPRRPMFFTLYDSDGDGTGDVYSGGVYGVNNNYANFSHFDGAVKEPVFDAILLGYHEVEFIRAEAIERGYNVSGTAESHYDNAITASMEWWGVDSGDITTYLAQPDVAYSTASGTYKDKIGLQKYIAMYPQGLQEWTEWRRLDAPTFNGIPSVNITEDDIPTRFTYPVDEQNLNEGNWEAASQSIGGDELTTKLFWDVN